MKLFREVAEEQRERNRGSRFGGWKGMILYIFAVIVLFYLFRNFTRESAETLLWFLRGGVD